MVVVLLLLAFGLRVWQLDSAPPGWRDDELINSLVISQKVLDGDLAVYYPDASGHEALYHALNAVMLGLFGPTVPGIRLLSMFLGTLTVALTYKVGRRMFGPGVGLVAAAGLAFGFWSLMYSRIGLRHVLTPPLMLGVVYFFWRAMFPVSHKPLTVSRISGFVSRIRKTENGKRNTDFLIAAVFMALGFYTYFASRGVPLILLAFVGYLLLVERQRVLRRWRGLLLMFGLAALLALPLVVTLQRQPESEARVAELAVPITEARQGNFEPLRDYTLITLSMFHSRGDNEWLYNIPERPLFGPIGAAFFWLGVAVAVWKALQPIRKQSTVNGQQSTENATHITHHASRITEYRRRNTEHAFAFLIAWWLAGIAPAFISVPPASLGHTILAQPAVYLLAAVGVTGVRYQVSGIRYQVSVISYQNWWRVGLALLFLGSVAARDWPDYFGEWPQRGMVRFLYRADIHEVAAFVNERPSLTDFGITGLLAGPWDKVALAADLRRDDVRARWFDPQRAALLQPPLSFSGYPDVPAAFADLFTRVENEAQAGGYVLSRAALDVSAAEAICFQNGLCWLTAVYHPETYTLDLAWRVERALDLPPNPLISNPPPPGVYSGPRLAVFAQLVDTDGQFITGDDGLWVDPYTLHAGDVFVQQHRFTAEGGRATAVLLGLYDPLTGARVLTLGGADHVRVALGVRGD